MCAGPVLVHVGRRGWRRKKGVPLFCALISLRMCDAVGEVDRKKGRRHSMDEEEVKGTPSFDRRRGSR